MRHAAGDEAEHAFAHREEEGTLRRVGIVNELIEHHVGPRPQRQLGAVDEFDLGSGIGRRRDELVLFHAIIDDELAHLRLERAGDGPYDDDRLANVIGGKARRGHARNQQSRETVWSRRTPDRRSHHAFPHNNGLCSSIFTVEYLYPDFSQ